MGIIEIIGLVMSAAGSLAKLGADALAAYQAGDADKALALLDQALSEGDILIGGLRKSIADQVAGAREKLAKRFPTT